MDVVKYFQITEHDSVMEELGGLNTYQIIEASTKILVMSIKYNVHIWSAQK